MTNPYHVAVIGAGSAGLFGARELAAQGVHVSLFNRDIKPGGLAHFDFLLQEIHFQLRNLLCKRFLKRHLLFQTVYFLI